MPQPCALAVSPLKNVSPYKFRHANLFGLVVVSSTIFSFLLLVDPRYWERLILHTCVFEHVCPLPARACVAMLEMLSEMVCAEELLRVVALSEFVQID